jgi:hypothetical protein
VLDVLRLLHQRIDVLALRGAVVAEVDDEYRAEPLLLTELLHDLDALAEPAVLRGVDIAGLPETRLHLPGRAEHHRIADRGELHGALLRPGRRRNLALLRGGRLPGGTRPGDDAALLEIGVDRGRLLVLFGERALAGEQALFDRVDRRCGVDEQHDERGRTCSPDRSGQLDDARERTARPSGP